MRARSAERCAASGPALGAPGLRLALAGGGTGGHVVPGLHLLAWARERRGDLPGAEDVLWFVSGRAIEARVLAGSSLEAVERIALAIEPEGGGAPTRGRLVWRTAPAVVRARKALRAHASEVLLGLGGYTSLPAVLAARSLRIPVALLEVNARAGAATRWLAPLADRVLHAWPETFPASETAGRARHVLTGPPLGPAFLGGAPGPAARGAARARFGLDPARPVLLVLGGSQGAGALNAFVRENARAIVAAGVQILHQAGPGRLEEGSTGLCGTVTVGYLDEVDRALAAATLVLCRGGASTLAEVAALRAPALVVPYPHHRDGHQEHNARQLGAGARIVPESELGPALGGELVRLCLPGAEAERSAMSAALASVVPAHARTGSELLYRELCALAGRASAA